MKKKILALFCIILIITTCLWLFMGCDENGEEKKDLTLEDFIYEKDGDKITIIELNNLLRKRVVIPEGVTDIKSGAFSKCVNMTTLVIPSSVTNIESGAFSKCASLERVTLSYVGESNDNNVNKKEQLFGYMFGTSYYRGGSLTKQYYGDKDFDCETYYIPSSLKEVTITGNSVPYGAFNNCSNIKTINLSNDITNIGDYAFSECSSLENVKMSTNVVSIGNGAFYGCNKIKSIEIPSSTTSIGEKAFSKCIALESIKVDENNSIYDSRDNSNSIIETATNTLIAGCKKSTIPNSVVKIKDNAFYECSDLKRLEIPSSVTSIGDNAFYGCFIEYAEIPAFAIPKIIIYQSLSSHSSIKEIIITSGDHIEERAFYSCPLKSIEIPSSITSIGNGAFLSCSCLENIKIDENNPMYDSRDNSNAIIETATNKLIVGSINTKIPDSVTCIGKSAFFANDKIENIRIPNNVLKIEEDAFWHCVNLKSVELTNSVTNIESGAFSSCSMLKKVYFKGAENDWNNIKIAYPNSNALTTATRYYYSETKPTTEGNYYHYDSNKNIVEW